MQLRGKVPSSESGHLRKKTNFVNPKIHLKLQDTIIKNL